jgi:hypothetical protein
VDGILLQVDPVVAAASVVVLGVVLLTFEIAELVRPRRTSGRNGWARQVGGIAGMSRTRVPSHRRELVLPESRLNVRIAPANLSISLDYLGTIEHWPLPLTLDAQLLKSIAGNGDGGDPEWAPAQFGQSGCLPCFSTST